MISQIYVEEKDKLLCCHDGGDRFSIEVDPDYGVPHRLLLSRTQLEILRRNINDALRRLDDITRLRGKVDTALACRPIPAEAVVDVDEFLKAMAAGFEPASPPEWAERNVPEEVP